MSEMPFGGAADDRRARNQRLAIFLTLMFALMFLGSVAYIVWFPG